MVTDVAKLRVCHREVEQEDEDRKEHCAADSAEEHGGGIIVQMEGQGWGHTVVRVCFTVITIRLKIAFWSVSTEHGRQQSATGGARRAAASTIGGLRTES